MTARSTLFLFVGLAACGGSSARGGGQDASTGSGASDGRAADGSTVGMVCTNPSHVLPANPSNPQDGITLSGFYVDTDTWNFANYPGSQQTMYVCDYNNWYATINLNNNNGDGAVKTYPNVHEDFNSPNISTFSSITSSFAHTAPTLGDWDFAYDIWINGVASNGSTELMIWTQARGTQVTGINGYPSMGSVTLSGITYDIHKSGSYIAYVMRTPQQSGTVNILEMFDDLISHGWIPSTSTLGAIDYGVEVCNTNSTDAKFEVNNFSLTTN